MHYPFLDKTVGGVIPLISAFAIFLATAFDATAQDRIPGNTVELAGKVIDAGDGYPLIGVSVMIEGTSTGAATDLDGNFTLEIPDETCNIAFSYVGYDTYIKEYNTRNADSFRRIVLQAIPRNSQMWW